MAEAYGGLEGDEELVDRLEKMGKSKRFLEALKEAAALLKAEMQRLAPVETGLLRASIFIEEPQEEENVEDSTIRVGIPAWSPALARALATEYGTRNMHSRPWARPALMNVRERIMRILREAAQEAAEDEDLDD